MLYQFLRWCPGILGLFLRQKLYPRYLKKCGHNVLFGRFVNLCDGKKTISIGSGVIVNDFATLYGNDAGDSDATLEIEDNVFIGAGTTIKISKGNILIRSGANLGSGCVILSDKHVLIDKDVLVAAFCEIREKKQKEKLESAKYPTQRNLGKKTRIDSGCWIGVRVRIADGVHIGKGTIVGAHAVVSADLPDYVVAIGDPARVLRERSVEQNVHRS